MKIQRLLPNHRALRAVTVAVAAAILAAGTLLAADPHTTGKFSGPKVNGGSATHSIENGKHKLSLSADFKAPDAPDPHWQVIDTQGQAHLLDKLMIKDKKLKNTIELPHHVPNIAKVQIWCAYAEVVLGEASFASPITTK